MGRSRGLIRREGNGAARRWPLALHDVQRQLTRLPKEVHGGWVLALRNQPPRVLELFDVSGGFNVIWVEMVDARCREKGKRLDLLAAVHGYYAGEPMVAEEGTVSSFVWVVLGKCLI